MEKENWRDMLGQARTLFDQIEAFEPAKATAEEKEANDKKVVEAKRLMAEAAKYKEIELSAKELDKQIAEVNEATKAKDEKMRGDAGGSDFKSLGDMIAGIYVWSRFGQPDNRLQWYQDSSGKETRVPFGSYKDLVESIGASGGFLVPAEFMANMYAVLAEQNLIRSRATIIPMRRRQMNIPVLDQTSTTAGQPHWFGGMQFYWAEEASQKTQSDPAFRLIELVAHKLIGYTRASDELLEDSAIGLEAFLMGNLGMAGGAAWMEESAFLRGTGTGQPLGVINAAATIPVARAAAGAIEYADLVNMLESFLPSGQGMWLAHQSTMSNLMTIQDQAGGAANTGSYIWGSAADGVPARLLGFPIMFTEKLPRIGAAGDILLADWKYYLIGDRKAVTIESTQFDRWRYDETSWRLVHRVDGQPWLSQPLTLQDGTSQVSPFVILNAFSS